MIGQEEPVRECSSIIDFDKNLILYRTMLSNMVTPSLVCLFKFKLIKQNLKIQFRSSTGHSKVFSSHM